MEIYNNEAFTSRDDNYKMILNQIEIMKHDYPLYSILSSVASLIYNYIGNISWAGFYLYNEKDETLYVGPYQGRPACLNIKIGRGVCGSSIQERITKIIDNVHLESNHIACDSRTNSEIVVPIIIEDKILGVIDIDSIVIKNFANIDRMYLEKIASLLKDCF